jgi:hypothetical protein
MNNTSNYTNDILKFKQYYFAIGGVQCPAFNNDLVFFNRKGWNHILRKQGKLRNQKDQLRRLRLISIAKRIIQTSNTWQEYRKSSSNNEFWSFTLDLSNTIITVIVRRDYNQKYFFSVMNN